MNNKNVITVKDIIESLIKAFVSLVCDIRYKIITELNTIMVIVQIIFPVLVVKAGLTDMQIIIAMCLFMLVMRYIKDFTNNINGTTETGIPIPRQRFTYLDNKGFVGYRQGIAQVDVMLYVNKVEEYLTRKGMM